MFVKKEKYNYFFIRIFNVHFGFSHQLPTYSQPSTGYEYPFFFHTINKAWQCPTHSPTSPTDAVEVHLSDMIVRLAYPYLESPMYICPICFEYIFFCRRL